MDTKLVECPDLILAGCPHGLSGGDAEVDAAWQALASVREAYGQDAPRVDFGVCVQGQGRHWYLAAGPVTNIDEALPECCIKRIPAMRYAVFAVPGADPLQVAATRDAAEDWLRESEYERAAPFTLERRSNGEAASIEILLPIR